MLNKAWMLSELLVMAASSNTGYFETQVIFWPTSPHSVTVALHTSRTKVTRSRNVAMSTSVSSERLYCRCSEAGILL